MATNEGMKDLITTVNKLQDAASRAELSLGKLDLPQIAVVGEQSTGKSSVLESFVGRDFLPRGNGIVTRRPLVLQMHHNETEEYAEFLHLRDRRFTNFLDVRKEIESETDRSTTGSKGISKVPINLRIYSPNTLELTLVDLPGITQVPVGDQPADIPKQILDMVLEYIAQENTLILAVSPANQDLANSNALKLAKSVDPEGLRTIGVVTKLDLMDRGTNARSILENKILPLRRGYVGLVNRSQEDIDKGRDIQSAMEEEIRFFRSQDAYKHMAERMGTKYLQQILNEQLCEHIRDKMPVIRANIKEQHQEVTKEMESLQLFSDTKTDAWKQSTIIKLVQEFSEDLRFIIEGNSVKIDGCQLNAGARMNYCMYQQIYKLLDQMGYPNEKTLKLLIQNQHGHRNPLFISEVSFDVIVRDLLKHYTDPLRKSVELISDILSSTVVDLSKKFVDYPRLKDVVQSLLTEKVKTYEAKTKKHLEIHIEAQAAFMNNRHPEFERISDPSQLPSDFKEKTSAEYARRSSSILSRDSTATPQKRTENAASTSESIIPAKSIKLKHKSWIGVFLSESSDDTKWYWFVLTNDNLAWYTSDNEKESVGNITVEGLGIVRDVAKSRYVIGRPGTVLSKELKTMTFTFRNPSEEAEWCEAFRKAGVEIKNNQTPNDETGFDALELFSSKTTPDEVDMIDQLLRRKQYDMVATDTEIQAGCDMLTYMVISYMKIVDKTVRDLVPKYIILLLVKKTVQYTSGLLLAEIMDKENWRDLLEVGPREMARREHLQSLYNSTKEAMEIMNKVDVL